MDVCSIALLAGSATLAFASFAAAAPSPGQPIRTLLLTGENNHNWRYTSRLHKETLEATGRFDVTIADDPAAALADADALASYDLIVLDYNGPRLGEAAEKNFTRAVEGGTGLVVIHAANNAFNGWTDYERMCGLLWRAGAGHGKFHEFDVRIVDADHPITKGLGDLKAHPDELYHNLSNAGGAEFRTLADAFDAAEIGGSGKHEPAAIVLTYGEGRVFHTPLGHVWTGVESTKASVADPQFRALLARGAEWAGTGEVTIPAAWDDVREHNTLTDEEKAQGWVLLFDGKTAPTKLRGFKQEAMPAKGWTVEDGTLRHVAGAGGGDIVTAEQFENFEFECEWKVGPAGNSGIIYLVTEDKSYPWETGPEMQILDNNGHPDAKNHATSAGALYALYPCEHDVARPAGEWNRAKVVVDKGRVEHWLNGVKIVETQIGGPDWNERVAKSKFASMPDFGKRTKGHIALQDHGDDVWFRNIKVRPLPR